MIKQIQRRFSQKIIKSLKKNVLFVSFNEPKTRNAISKNMIFEMRNIINQANTSQLAAVVFRSNAPGFFCAGANLKERLTMGIDETKEFVNQLRQTFHEISKLQAPTFSLIDGACLGGGLEFAINTDFRIATNDALIGLPEVALGIIPGASGTQKLPRLIGKQKAKRMIMFAERISGLQALELGLVDKVVHSYEELDLAMGNILKRLGVFDEKVLRLSKQVVEEGSKRELAQALVVEKKFYDIVVKRDERVEALKRWVNRSNQQI